MVSPKQQSKLMDRIKSMSELELLGFIEELQEHLYRNKMGHLLDSPQEEVEDLRIELDELQHEFNEYKQQIESKKQ